MTSVVTLNELRDIYYHQQKTFSLLIDDTHEALFTCTKIIRCLPGKRISCEGVWRGKKVFAKLFIAPSRTEKHWQKEITGVRLLLNRKICTPKLLHTTSALNNKIYLIFFAYISNPKPLQTIWDVASPEDKKNLLDMLLSTVAEHHSKGVIQRDLHINNFLLVGQQLCTLDGSDINSFDKDDESAVCNNLAQLFAQFYPSYDKSIASALNTYFQHRQWTNKQNLLSKVITETLCEREKRKYDFMAKTRRECSLFCVKKTSSQWVVYAEKYHSNDLLNLIASPDDFINTGQYLKQGKSSTVSIITVGEKKWVIKRYNIKDWKHFLSRALRPSRALKSWHNANLLKFYGIPSPDPVAIIEKCFGFVRKTAYFISEYVPGETYHDFLYLSGPTDEKKRSIAQSVCKLFRSLKKLNISHGDLKISNLMIKNDMVSLIDLDAMQQHTRQNNFQKSHKKDVKRFFKNWENDPANRLFFNQQCFDGDD